MKGLIRFLFVVFVYVMIVQGISCSGSSGGPVMLNVDDKPFEKLSEYHFFSGLMNEMKPNERVVPYDLITPLYTDYAFKARFVYIPEGISVNYDSLKTLDFPVGSCLIKNFYYPADFQKPLEKRRIIETRLLVHRSTGWEAIGYEWNAGQTEANLLNTGDILKVDWIHYDGLARSIDYVIPNKNQCKSCHWHNGTSISPIGPKVRNLNRDFTYAEGSMNQIDYWVKAGILKNAPAEAERPRLADWADSKHYTLNDRARAYLEVNCAHCHRPDGPAYTSGLHLNIENENPGNLGINKAPVAAGAGTCGLQSDIIPGKPENSILVCRMKSNEAQIKMPELGRSSVHTEAVALIEQWIAAMK